MLLKLLSKLSLRVLYLLARIIYFILYYIVRYRRRIVHEHICKAFPEIRKEEARELTKRFYQNLSDISVEIIKGISISKQEFAERVTHKNMDVVQGVVDSGQSFVLLSSHAGNWEWLQLAMGLQMPVTVNSIYKPLHSKRMDRLFYAMRTRFGANLVEAVNFMGEVRKNKNNQMAYAVLADQKPRSSSKAHTTQFLNRETRFFVGPEKIAQLAKMPVVLVSIKRLRRGYYEVDYELIAEPPYERNKDQYPITEQYVRAVEAHIYEHPDNWLWSHRRWRVRNRGKSVA